MNEVILVAVIAGLSTAIPSIFASLMQNKLVLYRIDKLEEKQDHYNNLQERTALNERDIDSLFSRVDAIEGDVHEIITKA